jgi:hypothetical protein
MITSDQLNWRFSKMTRRAGIGRWHGHEGRHTTASIMSSSGSAWTVSTQLVRLSTRDQTITALTVAELGRAVLGRSTHLILVLRDPCFLPSQTA